MKMKWFDDTPFPVSALYQPKLYPPTPYDKILESWGYRHDSSNPLIEGIKVTETIRGLKVTGKLTSEGLKIFEKEIETIMEKKYTPKKIIVNGPATIVMWNDGTKTVVKCEEDYPYANSYDAFNAALAKKIFGTNSHLKKVIDRAIELQIPKIKVNAKEVKNDGESK